MDIIRFFETDNASQMPAFAEPQPSVSMPPPSTPIRSAPRKKAVPLAPMKKAVKRPAVEDFASIAPVAKKLAEAAKDYSLVEHEGKNLYKIG
jgi:hypothetical protein